MRFGIPRLRQTLAETPVAVTVNDRAVGARAYGLSWRDEQQANDTSIAASKIVPVWLDSWHGSCSA